VVGPHWRILQPEAQQQQGTTVMRIRQKKLMLCLVGAAMALTSLAIADVVILDPAEIRGQVSFGSETVTNYYVSAYSQDGFSATGSYTSTPYTLTVESGHDYLPSINAYLSNPTISTSSLYVSRLSAVPVDNQNGLTTVDFNYPSTQRINFSFNVNGGTIEAYTLSASAETGAEYHHAYTFNGFAFPQPSSATGWQAMLPHSQVNVGGTAYLTTAGGLQVTRNLSAQAVDLLAGPADVSWEIDLLTSTGALAGEIELTTGTPISYHYVYVSGVPNTDTQGIGGAQYVPANGTYAFDLPPGEYDVFLRTYFPLSGHSDTPRSRVTIATGLTSTRDFIETLGTGQVPLVVSGFFTNSHLRSSSMSVSRQGLNQYAMASQYTLANGLFEPGLFTKDGRFLAS
jgi:hypothetical protein